MPRPIKLIDEKSPFNKYVAKHGKEDIDAFAKEAGLKYFQVYNIRRGKMPSLLTAVRMELFTKGELSCGDLLTEEKRKAFKEYKKEIKKKCA